MKETPKAMVSALSRISNLKVVEAHHVAEFEKRMRGTYGRRAELYMREARLRAEKIRDKALY